MSEDIQRFMGRVEAKLDSALEALKDHNARLRELEKWRWKTAGISTAFGAAAGGLVSKLLGST